MSKNKIKTFGLYPYKKILLFYIFLTVILIISVFYLFTSKALVLITFEQEKINSTFSINLGTETDIEKEIIKSEISEQILEEEGAFSPAQKKITETKVFGEVTIINNYNKDQSLVATTRLLSPEGLLYRTTHYVSVPAGGKVKVEVKADEEGKKYEIGPTTFTIPGLWSDLQDKIYGQSEQKMSKTTKEVGIIAQEDIKTAKEKIGQKLYNEILEKQKSKPQIVKMEILEESSDTNVGEEKENFKIKQKIKFITVNFDENDLNNLITSNFNKLIPPEKKLLSINKEKMVYELNEYNLEEKTGKAKISIEGNFVPDIETLNFSKDKLVKLAEKEVKEYFNNFSTIKNVDVKIKPFWLKVMPLLSDKIEIKIAK